MFSEHPNTLFAFSWVRINLLWSFQIMVKVIRTFITSWYKLRKMQISYQDVQKTSPTFACNFYSWKKYCLYLFIFNNVNTINYLSSFKGCFCPECKWYAHKGNVYLNILISYLHFSEFIWISYEFSKFWSNGQRAFEGPQWKK